MEGSKSAATSALIVPCQSGMHKTLVSNSPSKLQLSTADSDAQVLVQRRAERDKLKFLTVAEQPLGGLIEALRDVV